MTLSLNLLQLFKSRLRKSGYKDVALWEKALKEAFEMLKTVI